MASTILQSSLPITISESDPTSHGVILVKKHLRANIIIPKTKKQKSLEDLKCKQEKVTKKI